jgi:hypothetical protein
MSNMSSQRSGAGGLDDASQTASGMKPQGASGMNKPAGTPVSSGAAQVGAGMRQTADETMQRAAGLAESAKDLASQAGEKLLSSVEEQKAAGADFVSGMAGAMRRAANEFRDVPQASQYIRLAADQIDSVTDAFKRRDLNQVVSDVQGFARRQPTAFLGAAVLAGFAAVRFLKTSTASSPMTSPSAGRQSFAGQSYGTGSQPPMGAHPIGSSRPNWSAGHARMP